MTSLDQAIKTALEFENKVFKTYQEAEKKAKDDVGRKVFRTLANEEKGHIAYLKRRLSEWEKTGKVTVESLATAVPNKEKIREGKEKLKKPLKQNKDLTAELELLKKALAVEVETSGFYKKMVSELSVEGKQLFERFVEIEEGHVAIVQAEIDSVTGLGFWFDMQEFDLEAT